MSAAWVPDELVARHNDREVIRFVYGADRANCPDCGVERCDYEGPNGAHLPECPDCGSTSAPRGHDSVDDDALGAP